jgi:ribosome maturation factor RimP
MIDNKLIIKLVEEHCLEREIYPVEVLVSTNNRIMVLIDADQGVTIENCIALSRHIEGNLDREQQDFELEVSSAGLDQPLKIVRQYLKNIGRRVKVKQLDGKSLIGVLLSANEHQFVIESEVKVLPEGKKKKITVKKEFTFDYTNIQSTKLEISFK